MKKFDIGEVTMLNKLKVNKGIDEEKLFKLATSCDALLNS
jgi:hypothetical protein